MQLLKLLNSEVEDRALYRNHLIPGSFICSLTSKDSWDLVLTSRPYDNWEGVKIAVLGLHVLSIITGLVIQPLAPMMITIQNSSQIKPRQKVTGEASSCDSLLRKKTKLVTLMMFIMK